MFIDSRYPSDIEEFEDKYDYAYCKKLLKDVEGVYVWLKSLLTES